jgi:PAS domain S-box-containing protein
MDKKDRNQISKPHWYYLSLPGSLQTAVWISIIIVFVLSILDLTGWLFNITLLKSILPQWIPMKIITAGCFIFTASALVIIKVNLPATFKKILPRTLAIFIILVSLTTLYVYIYYIVTGHESDLSEVTYLTYYTAPESRMAFLTACNFFILGCIVILLTVDKTKTADFAHVLILPVSLTSYFVPVCYLLGISYVTKLTNEPVALNTGIAFCGICAAVLLIKPDTWLMKIFTDRETGGIVARKLFLPLMILPVVIAWLRINGERAGLFKSDEGVVLVALTYTACFLTLIWLTARSVSKIDQKRRISEDALRESEERFKAIAEVSPVGMGVVGFMDGNFLYINPSYEQYFGYDKNELLSKKSLDIYWDPKDRDLIYKKLEENNFVSNYEVKLRRKNGSSFWSMSSIRPIKFMNKTAFLGTFIDITDRKKAEKELQKTKDYLENLINYANAPIIVWDTDTSIQLFNHAFEHLTGYSSSEVEGKKLDLLFPSDSLQESNAKIKDALTENWKTIEIPILTKDKEIRIVLWNSANIYDTDKKSVLSTIAQGNDITERINAEQIVKERTKDLEVANIQLKEELRERFLAQEALRKSEAQLKDLNATKDKFFNIVAHDLKNPFTSLIGSSELLFRNIDKMDNEKIKTLALILNDASKNGYAILQNLLDWSRSQTGLLKFNPENINLKMLIDEHILNLEQISSNKEIKIHSEVKDDLFIYGDKNMIKTILRNLLSNAVKYSHRSGKVIVDATVNDLEVVILVKDNGIGIPEENINKIFRIDAKYSAPGTENEQGTGLGLKLCKEFVEKQGGKIWVESIENKGSEFKFSIPVKEE